MKKYLNWSLRVFILLSAIFIIFMIESDYNAPNPTVEDMNKIPNFTKAQNNDAILSNKNVSDICNNLSSFAEHCTSLKNDVSLTNNGYEICIKQNIEILKNKYLISDEKVIEINNSCK